MLITECRMCRQVKRIEQRGMCEGCLLMIAERSNKRKTAGRPLGRAVLVYDSPYLPPMRGWLIEGAPALPGTVWVRMAATGNEGQYPAELVEFEGLQVVA